MFELSVLAIFKNEDMIIENWIQHYLEEGIEHFYLIDNGSTDNYEEKIKKYEQYYTLIKDPLRLSYGTQTFLYNKHYLHKVKMETKWLIICDIDEYIYGRNGCAKIIDALNKLPHYVEKIWLPWKCFGSNGHKNHPSNIILSFNKYSDEFIKNKGLGKIILKTINLQEILTCGHDVFLNKNNVLYNSNGNLYDEYNFSYYNILNLHLNHYMLMSEEYYQKIKCTRGSGEEGIVNKYTMEAFNNFDKIYNKIVDNELIIKKKLLIYANIKQQNIEQENIEQENINKKNKELMNILKLNLNKIHITDKNNKQKWYAYKKYFKKNKNNLSITCIKDTFIKINKDHSSNLNDNQKIYAKKNTIFSLIGSSCNYYIIYKDHIFYTIEDLIL